MKHLIGFIVVLISVHSPFVYSKVLLVSMDGFRADYLTTVPNLTNFERLKRQGCNVRHVRNVFASATYPSHYTLATGMLAFLWQKTM